MTVPPSILKAFHELGDFLTEFCDETPHGEDAWHRELQEIVRKAGQQNSWFTKDNILFALQHWGHVLKAHTIASWLKDYPEPRAKTPKTIAIVMAGNIPLVGFHDFICVVLTGNRALAKLSSNDALLLPFLAKFLLKKVPELEHQMVFTKETLRDFDAVIATGSDNTGRYFEYYFNAYPNIIRKNRNSVAVLTGKESTETLGALGEDIFRHFGLGCRSVSKLMVPQHYNFDAFFTAIYPYQEIIHNHKYANNYDYNKAVFLMSDFKLLDNHFLLLKEDMGFASPIGTLYYEHYETEATLMQKLASAKDRIQCIVGSSSLGGTIPFGSTQVPLLDDYADGVDTIAFLIDL